MIIINIKTWA
ncbi:hypothetical protein YPPY89_4672, partial [Yersinia pestis PY-89]